MIIEEGWSRRIFEDGIFIYSSKANSFSLITYTTIFCSIMCYYLKKNVRCHPIVKLFWSEYSLKKSSFPPPPPWLFPYIYVTSRYLRLRVKFATWIV